MKINLYKPFATFGVCLLQLENKKEDASHRIQQSTIKHFLLQ